MGPQCEMRAEAPQLKMRSWTRLCRSRPTPMSHPSVKQLQLRTRTALRASAAPSSKSTCSRVRLRTGRSTSRNQIVGFLLLLHITSRCLHKLEKEPQALPVAHRHLKASRGRRRGAGMGTPTQRAALSSPEATAPQCLEKTAHQDFIRTKRSKAGIIKTCRPSRAAPHPLVSSEPASHLSQSCLHLHLHAPLTPPPLWPTVR